MARTTIKFMEILETFYLVKTGVQFCNERILPLIISRVEPEDSITRPPLFASRKNVLSKPNTVVTFMEADRIVGNYQAIYFLILYCAIPVLGLLGYVVTLVIEAVDSLIKTPNWVEATMYSLILITFAPFWTGVMISIKKRTMIWEEARGTEIEIRKLEYFAVGKSSEIIAKILFEIEKLKGEREEELGRVKEIRKKRSILDVETMKKFNAMMDEREKELKRNGTIKAVVFTVIFSFISWYFNASITYALEKVYDYIFYGIKPSFGGANK